jgi:hypothetical protein
MFVVPTDPQTRFLLQRCVAQKNRQAVQQIIFQGLYPSFEDGNAAALADRAKTGADAVSPTPVLVSGGRPERAAFVADEIPRRRTGGTGRSAKKTSQSDGGGRPSKDRTIHHAARRHETARLGSIAMSEERRFDRCK